MRPAQEIWWRYLYTRISINPSLFHTLCWAVMYDRIKNVLVYWRTISCTTVYTILRGLDVGFATSGADEEGDLGVEV